MIHPDLLPNESSLPYLQRALKGKYYDTGKLGVYEIDQRRANVLNHYRERGFAYNDGEWIITDPVLSSQIGDAMPMLNIKLYETFAKEDLSFLHNATYSVKDAMQRAYFAFDAVWRPAVLLRLGYPQRNVIEGTLRAALYNKNIMEVGMALAKGSKNLTNNLYHSIVSNRIEKYNIAQEMGINAPKATLSSWNSIVKWQKNELEIIRNRYKSYRFHDWSIKKSGTCVIVARTGLDVNYLLKVWNNYFLLEVAV